MTPLNIIMLNDTAYVNGGAAKVAIMEANGLAERGYSETYTHKPFCINESTVSTVNQQLAF